MRDGMIPNTHGKATSVRNYEFPNESRKVYSNFLRHDLVDLVKIKFLLFMSGKGKVCLINKQQILKKKIN